ncbi:MAG: transposase [Ignavibacteria bacterium]|jgi:REP element-mobilizing transposase RayT|nr:transposase [Ignavibacteria bacterium]MCU7519142.1 transposase [Ignavibacteria bacterium]
MEERHSIRLRDYDYRSFGYYFVTICAFERRNLFGYVQNEKVELNNLGNIVLEEWENSARIRKEISYDEYIIMPNHIHGIVIIDNPHLIHEEKIKPPIQVNPAPPGFLSKSLSSFISGFKSTVTIKARNIAGFNLAVWQRNYYEHIIRNEKELYTIQNYIVTNPAKWELDRYYLRE